MGNLERVLEIIAICIIYEDCYSIKRKKMERLYKKLESYGQSDYYPFHMPGHKRNRASSADDFLFERDITEISGFDNLHHAEGILKEAQEYAAQIYGTKKCFFSVNGSTAALLAAVSRNSYCHFRICEKGWTDSGGQKLSQGCLPCIVFT